MPILSDSNPPTDAGEDDAPADVERILRLRVPVIVRLASKKLSVAQVLRLAGGAILEFDKRSEDQLELLINNKVIGEGEAVKVGENFGLRITAIGDVRDKIRAMGG